MKNAIISTSALVATGLEMLCRSGSNGKHNRWARHISLAAMVLMIGVIKPAHSAPVILNTGQTVTGTTNSLSLNIGNITAGPNVTLSNNGSGNLVVSIKSDATNPDFPLTWLGLSLNTATYPYVQVDFVGASAGLIASSWGTFWQDDDSTIGGANNSFTPMGTETPSTGPFTIVIDLTDGGSSTSGVTGWGPGTLDAFRLDMFENTNNWGESYTVSAVTFGSALTPVGGIAFSGLSTTNITSDAAWPTATVNTNLDTCVLVWDTTDHVPGTTNDWPSANRLSLDVPAAGTITTQITGLAANTAYIWRFYGETATTNAWSSAKTFTTPQSSIGAKATGGVVTYYHDTNGIEWCAHIFTEGGTFTPSTGLEVEYLIVGGGGGGGAAKGGSAAGGGGAGGLFMGTTNVTNAISVEVGAGGDGAASTVGIGSDGINSSAFGLVAVGGGGGGSTGNADGNDGGSGGGGARTGSGGSGISVQGFAGGNGSADAVAGGGGGAGGAGGSPAGGGGLSSDISGTPVTYATGGKGGTSADGDYVQGANGAANTGQGGGGSYKINSSTWLGGNGGSGIVVVRYQVPPAGTVLIIR